MISKYLLFNLNELCLFSLYSTLTFIKKIMDCYKELKDNGCKLQHCIELIVYDKIDICTIGGEISLNVDLGAYVDSITLLEADQSICFKYLNCMEGYVYDDISFNIEDSLCLVVKVNGSITLGNEVIPPCKSYYKQISNSLEMKLRKLLDTPSELELSSIDLLLSNSSEFIPEIPQPIPFNTGTRGNINNQHRIKIRVLKSTTLCKGTTEERRIWLVAVVEFDNVPTLLLFNHLYSSTQFVPYRYKLDKSIYIQMVKYIHSLFVYEEEDIDNCMPYPIYNKELNVLSGKMTYPQRSIDPCEPNETIGLLECTEVYEDDSTIKEVLEADIDKFFKVYNLT